MGVSERFFQLGSQWNVIHLPQKPNGFGILILGDRNHFVQENTSFWLQHYGRNQLLTALKDEGYTLFNSHLHGNHWGCEDAVFSAKQLVHHTLKQEILNREIHVLAEGMGALVAMSLAEEMPEVLRSIALVNPCLHLYAQREREKEHKFFYKQLIKELAKSYGCSEKEAETYPLPACPVHSAHVPIHIWQRLNGAPYAYELHAKPFIDQHMKNPEHCQIDLTLHMFDHPRRIFQSIHKFYKSHEREL
ncbi:MULTISPECIES: hypothetical protein [Bacillus]|uniref:hypothetical protein n=1 Tax=Bacillus TaxID=1386 RepID=UPI000761CC7E|nr:MULTISPECIES: hypothetical protein [Bacillus]AOC57198.1 hypothetical protein BEN31_10400 [Bacillus pumilus]AZV51894.1 hypothetical protein DKE43_01795 [Bacillus pumilus]MBR0587631.1 hypothetical protein [Bacillus pumilus DW2J2]MBR0617340.1 hypothetical protein [Bacillus pumilus]MBR0621263.1 hypothetical protein [Bacillus pumilus]